MAFKLLFLCTLWLNLQSSSSIYSIMETSDDDFLKMTFSHKYIIIFFTKRNCRLCETMEYELLSVRAELEEALDTAIAKIYSSRLVRAYSSSKEPVLVFFRHGVPLLYLGKIKGEEILHSLTENKEPIVKELKDDNFEHLTQATTGSTTGDWFIMFYSKTCTKSRDMTASWEAVGAALRSRMNVARIDITEDGIYTKKRFDVLYTPSFVLLHHGYMYKYESLKLDVDSLVRFGRNFREMPNEKIPLPLSPMDRLLNRVTEVLEGKDWFWETGSFGLILGLGGCIYLWYLDRKRQRKNQRTPVESSSETSDTSDSLESSELSSSTSSFPSPSTSETEPEHEKEN